MHLQVQDVSKQYRSDFWGLREFNLDLGRGVIGLLGPNGAGKSTLMRMLATISQPTTGTILWNGVNIQKSPDTLRAVLGYLPQDFGVYPNLTGFEFLEYMAAIKGLNGKPARQRIDELVAVLNLVQVAKRPLASYSGGMKQRIGIAQALLNDPQLLIVDEPTVGLDPEERARFRSLLADLAGERIILLSTHIVSDVEATATEIVIINKGRMVRHAAPEMLIAQMEARVWQWIAPSEMVNELKQQYPVSGTLRREDGVQVRVVSAAPPVKEALAVAPTLEDVYLTMVSQGGNSA